MPPTSTLPRSTLEHIAHLARLRLTSEEIDAYSGQIAAILTYVETLQNLDTTGIEPLSHPSAEDTPLRLDQPEQAIPPRSILRNAPSQVGDIFTVPKVIED